MKKEQSKALKGKLLAAINKVLRASKADLTDKTQKVVTKSIKRIVQKTDLIKNTVRTTKIKELV